MKTTKIELTENELLDIINQIADNKDREILKEQYGEENSIHIDHEHINFIDPLYIVDEYGPMETGENEWTTRTYLTIIGLRCYGDGSSEIELSEYAKQAITTALDVCFYIEDEVKTVK